MNDLDQYITHKSSSQITKQKYSFDTSGFIESWRTHYPKDVFPRIWDFLKVKIKDNIIVASYLVKIELNHQQDDLTKFVNQFNNLFVVPNKEIQNCVNLLINNPNFNKWGISEAHQADPFVVALAKVNNLSVVSYENNRSKKNNIQAACREFKVKHLTFVEFLRLESFNTF